VIGRYDQERVHALADLNLALEGKPVNSPEFVYVIYIHTTPEKLWQALTDPTFTCRYWGVALESDWKVGSPVLTQAAPGAEIRDLGQVVLESQLHRRLSYSWHNYQREHAEIFGWTDEVFAELIKERRSKVTFELEPIGSMVKLTVIHDDFEPGSEMLKGVSEGWPAILSGLKTLLETGEPLPSGGT
jgi:uncharacterized protein YndB with AHSA1/START domain